MKIQLVTGAVFTLGAVICQADGCLPEWDYTDGPHGPAHWGELDEQFKLCGVGKNQSPVNLTGFIEAELSPIDLHYKAGPGEILNNGHTIQINYPAGSSLQIDGETFALRQFHFHTPSENHIAGKSYPMEAHLVHVSQEGNLAVVAVLFAEGEANPLLTDLWQFIPQKPDETHKLTYVDVNRLLPINRSYYRFNGSLTTPPCSEGVRWLVLKQSVSISAEQVQTFADVMHHDNNRPLQLVNARPLLK